MKIIIMEDEIPAYQKLVSYIKAEIAESELLGWVRSIKEAEALLDGSVQPDLIFADIELLDGSSFEIFEKVKISCPIIFCTAFDCYVLRAFKTNGIAYLLKPYSIESFREAYQKYQILFDKKENIDIDNHILSELKEALFIQEKKYKSRFVIKKKEGIKLLEIQNISCFKACGDFCIVFDDKGIQHTINYSMAEIESKIDPLKFFRINRSYIVNITHINSIELYSKNRLFIKLPAVKEELITSSNKTPEFRKWIEG